MSASQIEASTSGWPVSCTLSVERMRQTALHGGVVRGGALLRKPGLLLRIEAVAKSLAKFRCLPS